MVEESGFNKVTANNDTIFAYPRLSTTDLWFMRLGGNGLGNLLFTWARCFATAKRQGWQIIWPTWFSYKPKNWRVNPYDVRTYFDLFKATDNYITWPGKPLRLLRHSTISEDTSQLEISPGSIVVFRGMKDFFAPFLDDHELILQELVAITREKHLAGWFANSPAPLAIHVRRGDFISRDGQSEMVGLHNSLLPLDWYAKALLAIREEAGSELPVWLFSDGRDDELEALTALPSVKRISFGSSIADMLAMARCRFLIASGSTFSMWGSYLGQVPTLWHPGKMLQPLILDNAASRGFDTAGASLEFEWSDGDPLPGWVAPALRQAPEI